MTYVHGFHGNGGHFENSKTWMHLLRWGSTFLWSLVKIGIGSSVSENLVGQAHSEKKKKKRKRKRKKNNNNNNKKRCKNNKFPNFVWELNKKRSKNNKSPKLILKNIQENFTSLLCIYIFLFQSTSFSSRYIYILDY